MTTAAPVQTIDLCLGANASDANAHVLITVTDADHADAIVGAIADAQRAGALFQCEGRVVFARAVDRHSDADAANAGPAQGSGA